VGEEGWHINELPLGGSYPGPHRRSHPIVVRLLPLPARMATRILSRAELASAPAAALNIKTPYMSPWRARSTDGIDLHNKRTPPPVGDHKRMRRIRRAATRRPARRVWHKVRPSRLPADLRAIACTAEPLVPVRLIPMTRGHRAMSRGV